MDGGRGVGLEIRAMQEKCGQLEDFRKNATKRHIRSILITGKPTEIETDCFLISLV